MKSNEGRSVDRLLLGLVPVVWLVVISCVETDLADTRVNVFDTGAAAAVVCAANDVPEDECVLDCNDEWGGEAAIDECGKCVSGSTGLASCLCGNGAVNAAEACDDGDDNGRGLGYCKADCSGLQAPDGMAWVSEGGFFYGPGPDGSETLAMESFSIDIHEVTAGDYKACVNAGECSYEGSTRDSYRTYSNNKDNYPINFVNWQDAVDYCTWKGKRLPTEFEWEKAARGTNGRMYPWGNETAVCNYAVMNGCPGDTQSVGSKKSGKSPYGVYDMAGNVWEWTNSWYSSDQRYRVLRGGSFGSSEHNLRSSYRDYYYPETRFNGSGFRCVR